jgi:hypothetical protein
MQPGFYGGQLVSEEERDSDQAFGFIFQPRGGVLACKEAQKFVRVDESRMEMLWPMIVGFHQFILPRTLLNTVLGRLIRCMDTSNCSEEETVRELIRLVVELRFASYPPDVLLKAIKRTQRVAWCNLKPLVSFATTNDFAFLLNWKQCYDLFQKVMRREAWVSQKLKLFEV